MELDEPIVTRRPSDRVYDLGKRGLAPQGARELVRGEAKCPLFRRDGGDTATSLDLDNISECFDKVLEFRREPPHARAYTTLVVVDRPDPKA